MSVVSRASLMHAKITEWQRDTPGLRRPLTDLCLEIVNALSAGEPVAWQPVAEPTDSAPFDGRKVDLWLTPVRQLSGSGGERICDCWFTEGKWWRYDDSKYATDAANCRSEVWNVTHWMHRPAPPSFENIASPKSGDEK